MQTINPESPSDRSGLDFGDVRGNVDFRALGDIVAGNKITYITQVIAISDEVSARHLNEVSPYRGLDPFERDDRELFFGRDLLIKSLITELSSSPILLVLGASGSGKSSIVRAGLLPRLSKLLPQFNCFTLFPDIDPFVSLRSSLINGGFSQTKTEPLLHGEPSMFLDLLQKLKRPGDQWLFFVDQFEEVFTQTDERLRNRFIAALLAIAQEHSGSTKVVLAMRADFLERLSPFPEFVESIKKSIEPVTHMHSEELRLAIEQPAALHGVRFEKELVEDIMRDVQGQAGALPLLQYTLNLLWEEERKQGGLANRTLSTRTYRELGGVRVALQKRADEIYVSFGESSDPKTPSERQEIVRKIFLRLVDVVGSQGTADAVWRPVRRRVPIARFQNAEEQIVLTELINQKLLVSNRVKTRASDSEDDISCSEATVEVAHEALFTCWEQLEKWIAAAKHVIFLKNRIADDSARWKNMYDKDAKRAEDELWAGSRLDEALRLCASNDFVTIVGCLSDEESRFLDLSVGLRDKRRHDEEGQRRRELDAARKLAETASQANVSLARYSHEAGDHARALAHLAQALRLNQRNSRAAELAVAMLTQVTWPTLLAGPMRHEGAVYSAQFSPDGQRVVTASGDKTARVWDALTYKVIGEPLEHKSEVKSAQFSPDGQRVVTASSDTARVWDALTSKVIGEPMQHEAEVYSTQFSPDSQWVLTASGDKTARVWDALTGAPIGEPMQHGNSIFSAQFSPDGKRVVTASWDMTAQVWDARSAKAIGEPMQHGNSVYSAQFSPGGGRVVTASWDMTARVWDALTGKPIGEPMQHEDWVWSAKFSPDGQRVLTTSSDNTARVWDAPTGKPIGEPMQHEDEISSAQFSPDGQRVVTASGDKTARVWDALTGKVIGEPMQHGNSIFSAHFSPDGARVITASWDKTAQVWDALIGKVICEPMQHEDKVDSARFNPDGRLIVTTSSDNTVRVWEALTGKPIGEPMQHAYRVKSARFSPDSQHVAIICNTASGDKRARVWDALTGKPICEPMQHEDRFYSARFSPDGQRVVTTSLGMTAQLWSGVTGEAIGKPMQHKDWISSAQFSADGRLVVTTSNDKTARIWDALTGKPIGEPMQHAYRVKSGQFSLDGQRVLTTSDKTARVWDALSGKAIGEPMQHQEDVSSPQFSPDGQRVLTTCRDKTARVWDAATGKALGEPMQHGGFVSLAQFSPDWQRVLTTSDKTARVWDILIGKPIGEPMRHAYRVSSAQFSPDGQRVLTTSDKTARVWDALSGKVIGEPMQHEDDVSSAQFSPDGQRVLTTSDKTARVWDVPTISDEEIADEVVLLADLAEAIGRVTLQASGQGEIVRILTPEQIRATLEEIASRFAQPSSKSTPLQRFLKWFVAERRSRTISPFCGITAAEWVEKRIKDQTLHGMRAAIFQDPGNARLAAHFGRRLADHALAKDTDLNEARRAMAEADFQTRRALNLARDDDEIKKCCAEVDNLLRLNSISALWSAGSKLSQRQVAPPRLIETLTPSEPENYPCAKKVPGKPGIVISPFAPTAGYVNVEGFSPGARVKDPYTGKILVVP